MRTLPPMTDDSGQRHRYFLTDDGRMLGRIVKTGPAFYVAERWLPDGTFEKLGVTSIFVHANDAMDTLAAEYKPE